MEGFHFRQRHTKCTASPLKKTSWVIYEVKQKWRRGAENKRREEGLLRGEEINLFYYLVTVLNRVSGYSSDDRPSW